MAVRSKTVAARLLELWVRILPEDGCLFLVIIICCQVKVSESG